MVAFSKERVEDLKSEVETECKNIEPIIRSFVTAKFDLAGFSMSAKSLYGVLRVPSVCPVTLYNHQLQQMNEDSAYELWKYLFDISFLGARLADGTMPKGFVHRSVHDDATLITKGRRRELDQIHWDVNPAYRDFLYDIRKTEYLGLSNPGAKYRHKNNY